ncbi:unnamed protein product [Rotaria sp. Silwood1]|nr:unnamed protein product [Rotaria sp. Silwood1]CAF4935680.1 unnamed protein product [Rotaria sp. Silwood1]CAF4978150.1 unnamed protein product [Rotaria sp. Silwood1]
MKYYSTIVQNYDISNLAYRDSRTEMNRNADVSENDNRPNNSIVDTRHFCHATISDTCSGSRMKIIENNEESISHSVDNDRDSNERIVINDNNLAL